jgi:alkyldihydroxyacetonephosphate synthase
MKIDRDALLIDADGQMPIRAVQRALDAEGLTLALEGELPEMTVAAWLAEGAPGARARFVDPVDQLVSGFTARFHDGRTITMRPAPRRSVGPDLWALVFGQKERFGKILRADLRAIVRDGAYVSPAFRFVDRPVSDEEAALLDAIEASMSAMSR